MDLKNIFNAKKCIFKLEMCNNFRKIALSKKKICIFFKYIFIPTLLITVERVSKRESRTSKTYLFQVSLSSISTHNI